MPATKKAPVRNQRTAAEEMIERRMELAHAERSAREHMLTEICNSHASLEPNDLNLSPTQMLIFNEDIGLTSVFEISKALRSHRAKMDLRAEVGDPAVLADARKRLDEANAVLSVAVAELDDLTVSDRPGDTPPLRQQIERLERRLSTLILDRDTAAEAARDIENKRKTLRNLAPKWLSEKCQRDLHLVRRQNKTWLRIEEVKAHLRTLGNWMPTFLSNSTTRDETFSVYIHYCLVYLPEAVSEHHGIRRVDLAELHKHYDWLVSEEVPRLKAELEKLETEWAAFVADVEQPITRWCETGECMN